MERNYVIVSNEHSYGDRVVFWGRRTLDDEKRSFGGYTTDLYACEVYTRQELEDYRKGMKNYYPFFDEIRRDDFYKHEEVLLTIEELISLGYKEMSVMTRT